MRNFAPQTRQFNERPVTRAQGDIDGAPSYKGGAYNDLPATNIPVDGLLWLENYRAYPKRIESRTGSQLWSTTTLPALSGRTGYSLTKSGTTVTKTVGTDFNVEDIGNFIVYDDGKREKITGYTDDDNVTVEGSTAHDASTAAYITGQVNGIKFHKKRRLFVLHIGYKIYYADSDISSWTEIPPFTNFIGNSLSTLREDNDFMIIGNARGIFRVYLGLEPYVYWKMNAPAPSVLITEVAKSSTKIYGYKYLYKMSRIVGGSDLSNRFGDYDSSGNKTGDTRLLQESAPNKWDANNRDYGTVYAATQAGEGGTYYGVLTGGALADPYDVPGGWDAIADGQFNITIDGTGKNITCDFTGVTSMTQIAEIIDLTLKDAFPDSNVSCTYSTDHFVIKSSDEGGTAGYTSAGDGGTDIGSSVMECESGTASLDNTTAFTSPLTISELTVPRDTEIGYRNSHWTHFTLYRTLDVGEKGINPVNSKLHDEELFMWMDDIPIAKAFMASISGNIMSLNQGVFQKFDVGSTVEFADGTEVTITSYTDAKTAVTTGSASVSAQSAAIGGGKVMTASQTGTTVTRTAGDTFTSSDVGKVLFWANGAKTVITAYTDANTVSATSANISSTGVTLDPVSRKYYDIIRDYYTGTDADVKQLNPRTVHNAYLVNDRFYEPLPNCDVIEIIDRFFFGAARDGVKVYYSATREDEYYLWGNYFSGTQFILYEDRIKYLAALPQLLVATCSNSTYAAPTNTYIETLNENTGNAIFTIAANYRKDANIGVIDWGSIWLIEKRDKVFVVARNNDNGVRYFNGNVWSEDETKDRIHKKIALLDTNSTAGYHPSKGYFLWSKTGKDDSTEESDVVYRWYDQYDASYLYRNKYRNELIREDRYALT